ncbi:MAG: hypothetical protein HOH29_02010 [Cellvibrionales bacterium]|jgi:hypothetical protein|nr:hypothetical protein [Cellvibrionales bacterium]
MNHSAPSNLDKNQAQFKSTKKAIHRWLTLLLTTTLLCACQTTPFNDTAYPFVINSEKMAEQAVDKVIIAHVNLGSPSKHYLKNYEKTIDKEVIAQLESAGYTIENNTLFRKAWRDATRKYGEPFNPVTSQVNARAFQRVIYTAINTLKEQTDIKAVVFTDLIERQVAFGHHINRNAKWDGVSRKPKIKGAGTGISQGFDWSQTVPAASLSVTVYHVDGQRLFQSIGGLEVTRQLDPNKGGNGRFVRRDKLFTSQTNVRQGVNFALHPFVKMKGYPEKK